MGGVRWWMTAINGFFHEAHEDTKATKNMNQVHFVPFVSS
jgi:hypothetical protein